VIVDDEDLALSAIDRGIAERADDEPPPVEVDAEPVEENIVTVADVPEVVRKTRSQRKRSRKKVQ